MFARFSAFVIALNVTLVAVDAAHAQSVAPPEGAVILTVTGAPDVANVGGTLQFDRHSFAALGLHTITTTTIWTEGPQRFEGVPLATLAALIGIEKGTLNATAINDYTVEIPVSDAVEGGPIIALKMNGEDMAVRDKGPLWVIYPYDSKAQYRTEVIYSRSIWQLDRIEVVE